LPPVKDSVNAVAWLHLNTFLFAESILQPQLSEGRLEFILPLSPTFAVITFLRTASQMKTTQDESKNTEVAEGNFKQ
jgi:hypothetical protein